MAGVGEARNLVRLIGPGNDPWEGTSLTGAGTEKGRDVAAPALPFLPRLGAALDQPPTRRVPEPITLFDVVPDTLWM